MLRRIVAMVIFLVIVATLLAAPAYGNLQRGDERAVQAYNSYNLHYDAGIFYWPLTNDD